MTARAELIYDHELPITQAEGAPEMFGRIGAMMRGYEADGRLLWVAVVEWLGQGDAIAVVTYAVPYAYGPETKPIIRGDRIHVIWA